MSGDSWRRPYAEAMAFLGCTPKPVTVLGVPAGLPSSLPVGDIAVACVATALAAAAGLERQRNGGSNQRLAAALPLLLAGDIDFAFGHIEPARLPPVLKQRVVIDEPLGILVPQDHHRRDSRSRAHAAHRFQSRPIAGECSGADPCDIQMLAVLHNAIDRAHTAWDGPDATM